MSSSLHCTWGSDRPAKRTGGDARHQVYPSHRHPRERCSPPATGLHWSCLTSAFRVDARRRQDPGEVAFATSGTRDHHDARGEALSRRPDPRQAGCRRATACPAREPAREDVDRLRLRQPLQRLQPANLPGADRVSLPPGLGRCVATSHRLLGDVAGRAAAPRFREQLIPAGRWRSTHRAARGSRVRGGVVTVAARSSSRPSRPALPCGVEGSGIVPANTRRAH